MVLYLVNIGDKTTFQLHKTYAMFIVNTKQVESTILYRLCFLVSPCYLTIQINKIIKVYLSAVYYYSNNS